MFKLLLKYFLLEHTKTLISMSNAIQLDEAKEKKYTSMVMQCAHLFKSPYNTFDYDYIGYIYYYR